MFGLLHNLYTYCKAKTERKLTIALLGVDNAGKTTLLNSLLGEVDKDTTPTFGFNSSTLTEGKYKIQVFDLGGGKSIRSVWKKYLAEVHAIVYVVDAADAARLEESKQTLFDALTSPYLADKPILVFANKQDLPSAAQPAAIVEGLGLAAGTRNSYNVFSSTAKVSATQRADPRIREGLRWLISCIDKEYSKLAPRVQREADDVRTEEARKKKEREERLRKQREERLRQQQEEEARQGTPTERENVLNDGKVGLPNQIESPGKGPMPNGARVLTESDLRVLSPDQGVVGPPGPSTVDAPTTSTQGGSQLNETVAAGGGGSGHTTLTIEPGSATAALASGHTGDASPVFSGAEHESQQRHQLSKHAGSHRALTGSMPPSQRERSNNGSKGAQLVGGGTAGGAGPLLTAENSHSSIKSSFTSNRVVPLATEAST